MAQPISTREILEQSLSALCLCTGKMALMLASGRGLTRSELMAIQHQLSLAQVHLRGLTPDANKPASPN